MPNLGGWEFVILIGVLVLLFGAKRLPEVGASIGKGIREFKRSLSDTQDAIMGQDDPNRSLASRPADPQNQPAPGAPSGEPKRLSQ